MGKQRKFEIGVAEGVCVVIICQEKRRNTALKEDGKDRSEKGQRGAPAQAWDEPAEKLHRPPSPSGVI